MKAEEQKKPFPFWIIIIVLLAICYLFWDSISKWMEQMKFDPAAWLDSPYVFNTVFGIAIVFILFSIVLAVVVKFRLRKAEEWAKDRSEAMLISLLGSTDPRERSRAYMVLRRRLHENLVDSLLRQLKTMEDEDTDPRYVIYLLEDLEASRAIPALRRLLKPSKKRPASVARAARIALESIPQTDSSSVSGDERAG